MDWSQLAAAVISGAVGGGAIGGAVSLAIAKRESRDRGALLALEREKWEYERDRPLREQQATALQEAMVAVGKCHIYVLAAHKGDQAGLMQTTEEQVQTLVFVSELSAATARVDGLNLPEAARKLEEFGQEMVEFARDAHAYDFDRWNRVNAQTIEALKAYIRAVKA